MRIASYSCCSLVALASCAAGDPFGLPASGPAAVARVRMTAQPAAEVAAIVAEVMGPRCCRPLGSRVGEKLDVLLPAVVREGDWVVVAGTPQQVGAMIELIDRLEVAAPDAK